MTKKDYQKFATMLNNIKELKGHCKQTFNKIVEEIGTIFAQDNSRFDRDKFEKWVNEGK